MTLDLTNRASTAKRVPCPSCGGDSVYAESNEFRPFCSNRCKNIDLGAWANEDFRMSANTPAEDQLNDGQALPS